jgi:hypothetical protein
MHQKRKAKRRSTRTTLRLPDLDHSKNSVLQSLGSAASKRTYGAAIEDFITWYTAYPTARSTAFLRFSDDKTDELSRGYPNRLPGQKSTSSNVGTYSSKPLARPVKQAPSCRFEPMTSIV